MAITMDMPTAAELAAEEFEARVDELRCPWHAELIFIDVVDIAGSNPEYPDQGFAYICNAADCGYEEVVR